MEKEFVPYQQAVSLKELGFDEPCFAVYEDKKWFLVESKNSMSYELCLKTDTFPVPTFSQAFRWFRDKHNIDAWVQPFMMEKHGTAFLPDESYGYWIFKDGVLVADEVDFLNPEEAELACLIKLIEIVKNSK
jgi:hypothetical protein